MNTDQSVEFANSGHIEGEKRGREVPGLFLKVPGPSGSLGPVLAGPRDLQGL